MALTKFPIEFTTAPSTTPQAVIKTLDGQAWNTSGTPALEAYSTAHYANYAIQLTQLGSSRSWYLTVPSTLPAGNYNVTASVPLVTATPVESTDVIAGVGPLNWDGTNLLDAYSLSSRIPTALGANGNIKADVRDFNGTACTSASGVPTANLNYAQVAPVFGTNRDTLGMILYRDHLAPHSRKPVNWPMRFTMSATNTVDTFTNVVMVWHDDISKAPGFGVADQMTDALRPYAYGGYVSLPETNQAMMGLCQDGRMVLLLNDGGNEAGEWYGSYSFDGIQWTDLATTGKDPTPLSDPLGDWDLSTAPGHGSIVVSFSTYVFSDAGAAINTKTAFLPPATAGAAGGLFIAGTNAQTTVTGGFGANSITATSLAADTITDAKVASDVTIASVTGAVGSVTGAVTLTSAYDAAKTAATATALAAVGTNVSDVLGSQVTATASLDTLVNTVETLMGDGFSASTDTLEKIADRGIAIKAKSDQLTFTTPNVVDASGGDGGGVAAQVDNSEIVRQRVFKLGTRKDGVVIAFPDCPMIVGEKYPVWIDTSAYNTRFLEDVDDAISSDAGLSVVSTGMNQLLVVVWLHATVAGPYTVTVAAHPRAADSIICQLNVTVVEAS